jgi:hypothetical protein
MVCKQKWLRPVATAAVLVAVSAAVALVPRPGASFDGSPSKCAAGKIEAAEKKVSAILQCVRRGVSAGEEISEECIIDAISQFTERFTAAESLGDCVTSGDVETIEEKVDSFIVEVLSELLPTD